MARHLPDQEEPMMKILVACEESQAVTIELRRLGHEAYSCDTQPCSGGHPEWHIQDDVLHYIDGSGTPGLAMFVLSQCGDIIEIPQKWDMIIAFPPCTYLSKAGGNRLRIKGEIQQERYKKGLAAKEFFMKFYTADCPKIAIENPIPLKIYGLPPYSQIVQPHMFGDPWLKTTCLWLKGGPILMATDIVVPTGKWVNCTDHRRIKRADDWARSGKKSQKERSKTFPGIARAMAEQWAGRCGEVTL